jgi:ABC-type glutathione transport system ATPase component
MSNPKLLLLDEPSLGLSPILTREVGSIIERIADEGVSILLIEQNANVALKLASKGYVLETGKIALGGDTKQLQNNDHVKAAYLGLSLTEETPVVTVPEREATDRGTPDRPSPGRWQDRGPQGRWQDRGPQGRWQGKEAPERGVQDEPLQDKEPPERETQDRRVPERESLDRRTEERRTPEREPPTRWTEERQTLEREPPARWTEERRAAERERPERWGRDREAPSRVVKKTFVPMVRNRT